jgi:alkylhydroperoxidase/carboxymuconolactone decarboxylase family protein YurZ
MGDTITADSLLNGVIARGPPTRADALMTRSLLAAAQKKPLAGLALREALAAGADTGQVRAALSLLAARNSRWREAAFQARGSLAAAQGTFRHPYPGEFLTQAMSQVSLEAPPELADSVLRYAVLRRPGSARYREFAAAAALRAGRCEEAAATFVELMDFAIRRDNGPALVRECWAGQRATVESTGIPPLHQGGSGAVRRTLEKATH